MRLGAFSSYLQAESPSSEAFGRAVDHLFRVRYRCSADAGIGRRERRIDIDGDKGNWSPSGLRPIRELRFVTPCREGTGHVVAMIGFYRHDMAPIR